MHYKFNACFLAAILLLNFFAGCIDESVDESERWAECDNGTPILYEKWMDGDIDCTDGSDEDWFTTEWCLEENKLQLFGNETDIEKVIKEYLDKRTNGVVNDYLNHMDKNGYWRIENEIEIYLENAKEAKGICDFKINELIETGKCVLYASSITVLNVEYKLRDAAHNVKNMNQHYALAKSNENGEWGVYPYGDFPTTFDCGYADFKENLAYGNDSDNDGINDISEFKIYGTNATNNDTDGDGITDYDEITIYLTNPLENDTDGDGLSDWDEIVSPKLNHIFTNPLVKDSDGDGINDYDEIEDGFITTHPLNVNIDRTWIKDIWIYNDLEQSFFGEKVSVYNNTLLTTNIYGDAFIYQNNENTWELQQTINLPEYVWDFAISEEYAIFGVAESRGAVHIYKKNNDEDWTLATILTLEENAEGTNFGVSLDFEGDYLAVKAKGDTTFNCCNIVYIFKNNGENWFEETNLSTQNDDCFWNGYHGSISISENYIVIGALDEHDYSAYVFKRENSEWILDDILKSNEGKYFGKTVLIDNNTIIVAAPYDQDVVYVFENENENWILRQTLTSNETGTGFGNDMSISNNFLAIGAGNNYVNLFKKNGDIWEFYSKIDVPTEYGYWQVSSVDINNGNVFASLHELYCENGEMGCGGIYICSINITSDNACSKDLDMDGLYNKEEIEFYGTNPFKSDTDEDGLTDYDEIRRYQTNPNQKDSDNDGIIDIEENVNFDLFNYISELNDGGFSNTSAHIADSDQDGLNDGAEIQFFKTDPLAFDSDGDGLSDGEEYYVYNTKLNQIDSDFDGMSDFDEIIIYGTDPNGNTNPEIFYKGAFERVANWFAISNFYLPDSDGDGLVDSIDNCPDENSYGYDANYDGCIDKNNSGGSSSSGSGYSNALACGQDGHVVTYIGDTIRDPDTGKWAEVYVCDGKTYYYDYYK